MARVPVRFRDGSLPRGVHIAGPSIHILRKHPEYVDRVHAKENVLYAWTVNRFQDVDLCASRYVDAIITDRPRRALERLGGTPSAGTGYSLEPTPDLQR
jgi:glycerophosphoryl diester phosphodiesterase